MTSLWADERVYYPVDFEPYTPAHHFAKGKKDPQFRTKLKLAVDLVHRAVQAQILFRAVVADSFYGEDHGVKQGLRALGVGYVLALKPSHAWWHPRSGDRLVPGSRSGGKVEEPGATWEVGQGDPHVPRRIEPGLVGLGSRHRPLWTHQAGAGRDRHDRSGHLARPDHVLVF